MTTNKDIIILLNSLLSKDFNHEHLSHDDLEYFRSELQALLEHFNELTE